MNLISLFSGAGGLDIKQDFARSLLMNMMRRFAQHLKQIFPRHS